MKKPGESGADQNQQRWAFMMCVALRGRLQSAGSLVTQSIPSSIRRQGRIGLALLSGILLLAVAFSLLPPRLWAQVDAGTIQGTVTDSSGANVRAASVAIRDEGTGFTQTIRTGADGTYIFTPVRIGIYSIEASAPGFEAAKKEHVSVSIQEYVVVDLRLAVSSVTSTVQVTTGQAVLQTQSASVGQIIAGAQINSLPLNGRNYTLLAQLAPGTTTEIGNPAVAAEQNGVFVANGLPTVYNTYLLDGISNNNDTASWGVEAPNQGPYVIKPPPEGLAEFRVETANYSAEYGRSGGAVVNAVTKSGANNLFGNVWEYIRNSDLDANDYILKSEKVARPEYRRNQYGFALGGPVVIPHLYNGHNKTFFFMDYEGQRIRQGLPYTSTVATALEQSSGFTNYSDLLAYQTGTQTDILGRTTPIGTVFDPATTRYLSAGYADPVTGLAAKSAGYVREAFPGNIIPAGRLSPVSTALLALYPAPTKLGITSNYVSAPVESISIDGFDIRVDQNFSDKDQFFGRVSYNTFPETIPTPCPGVVECSTSSGQGTMSNIVFGAAVGETHIFSPRLVNEVRIGYSRDHSDIDGPYGNVAGLNAQYGIPGIPDAAPNGGLTQMAITGLSTIGGHNNTPLDEIASESQYNDNVSLEAGHHSMRFGGTFQGIKSALYSSQFPHGYFTFSGGYTDQTTPGGTNTASTGIAQFAIQPIPSIASGCTGLTNTQGPPTAPGCYTYNYVGGATNVQGSPLSQQDYRKPYLGGYFNDTWKIRPNLTLNLGLRFEHFRLDEDHNGRAASFVPSFASKNGLSSYLIDNRSQNIPLSPSFVSLLASQNIALTYTSNHQLGHIPPADFSPRLGFAWQATSKSVLRGGYGISFAGVFVRGDGYNTGDNYPFAFGVSLTSTTSAGLSNDGSIGPISKGLSAVPLTTSTAIGSQISPRGIQYYRQLPYVQSANLSFQYELSATQYLEVSYVGNDAQHLESNIYSNTVSELLPVVLPAGTSLTNYLPYPGITQSNYYIWSEGIMNYNSLQAKYEKLFSHGTNLIADYTWAKNLGDGSDILLAAKSFRAPHVPGFGMQGDYGETSFESKSTFHMGGGWELPVGVGRHWINSRGAGDLLLGGWNLNAIITYQAGEPVVVGCSSSTSTGLGCNSFTNPKLIYQGAKTVAHWFNPAAFTNAPQVTTVGQTNFAPLGQSPSQGTYGPAFHRGDIGIQKLFHISEQTNLEFRAEFFNVLNTPNFAPPGTLTPTSSAFASITSTRDSPNDPREIQFALKLNFGGSKH